MNRAIGEPPHDMEGLQGYIDRQVDEAYVDMAISMRTSLFGPMTEQDKDDLRHEILLTHVEHRRLDAIGPVHKPGRYELQCVLARKNRRATFREMNDMYGMRPGKWVGKAQGCGDRRSPL